MLLKISLYSGNRFCIHLVDLVAVSFVSWMFIIAVFLEELYTRFCRFGKAVLSEDAFHVIIFVSSLVLMFILGGGVGMFGRGGGCEYSFRLSKQRRASVINLFGKKGNFLWSMVGVGGVSWLWINLYSSS